MKDAAPPTPNPADDGSPLPRPLRTAGVIASHAALSAIALALVWTTMRSAPDAAQAIVRVPDGRPAVALPPTRDPGSAAVRSPLTLSTPPAAARDPFRWPESMRPTQIVTLPRPAEAAPSPDAPADGRSAVNTTPSEALAHAPLAADAVVWLGPADAARAGLPAGRTAAPVDVVWERPPVAPPPEVVLTTRPVPAGPRVLPAALPVPTPAPEPVTPPTAADEPARRPAASPTSTASGGAFYGLPVGQRTVYVLDASGSMIDTLAFALDELRSSLRSLSPGQSFAVLFFADRGVREAPPRGMRPATPENLSAALRWLEPERRNIAAAGRPDALPALRQALSYRPDTVVLLSDGITGLRDPQGDRRRLAELIRQQATGVRFQTIQFVDADPLAADGRRATLELLAAGTGGQYRFVSIDDARHTAAR